MFNSTSSPKVFKVPLEDALKEGPEGPEDALLPRVALPAEGPVPEVFAFSN